MSGKRAGGNPTDEIKRALLERERKRNKNISRCSKESDELRAKGNAFFKEGNYAKAIKLYRLSLRCAVSSKDLIYSNMAAAFLKLCSYKEAAEAATNALRYNPTASKPRYRRAVARRNLGQSKGALIDLTVILTIEPNCPDAQAELNKVIELSQDGSNVRDAHKTDEQLEYPVFNASPMSDSDIESDSSDCRHSGNGIPCRYYNRRACNKGKDCLYSHAPDQKSIRDRLGRNVCLYHIVSDCKFGEEKCSYSHSMEYLPKKGWWNNLQGNRDFRVFIECAILDHFPITRTLARKVALYGLELKDVMDIGDGEESDDTSDGEEWEGSDPPMDREIAPVVEALRQRPNITITYESAAPLYARGGPMPPPPSQQITDRFILLLTIEDHRVFYNVHRHLLYALQERIRVEAAHTKAKALKLLSSTHLAGVIVGDAGIARPKGVNVLAKLVEYVKGGGKVVLSGGFANFVNAEETAGVFRQFGLSWKKGSYYRTTVVPNSQNPIVRDNPSLDDRFSMKAGLVTSISPGDAFYMPNEQSLLESFVYPPTPITNLDEAPSVGRKIGEGYLGFVGDANGETGATKIFLAMLGLLDTITTFHSPTRDSPSISPGQSRDTETEPDPVQTQEARRSVLIMSFKSKDVTERAFAPILSALNARAEVLHDLPNDHVLELLGSSNLGGLIITNCALMDEENAELLSAIVGWTKAGGRVILVGFLSNLDRTELLPAFFRRWVSNGRQELTPALSLSLIKSTL
ncbi:hypothetical protein AX16_008962 [Volvariella volvacea WC 439]|nr:hypothetical protein AX16_008962 [Volvariella volvacea WC 439]